jgi:hypothetical protein
MFSIYQRNKLQVDIIETTWMDEFYFVDNYANKINDILNRTSSWVDITSEEFRERVLVLLKIPVIK